MTSWSHDIPTKRERIETLLAGRRIVAVQCSEGLLHISFDNGRKVEIMFSDLIVDGKQP